MSKYLFGSLWLSSAKTSPLLRLILGLAMGITIWGILDLSIFIRTLSSSCSLRLLYMPHR